MSNVPFEEIDIDPQLLVDYEYNAKEHTEKQVDDLAHSLADFGQFQPIVVDEKNVIIIGHGRKMGAIKLGLPTVKVWRISGYSEDQKRALRIVDNKLNMDTGFDVSKLKLDVTKANEGYDLSKYSFNFDFANEGTRDLDVDTTKEKLEAYENADAKQIVLYFDSVLFDDVNAKLAQLRQDFDIESNSDVLIMLLAKYGVEI